MKTLKSVRLDNALIDSINAIAEKERRTFSNQVECILAESVSGGQEKKTGKRFVEPTLSELQSYIAEKGYTFDAETFMEFYNSKGWKIGNTKMKSWQSACVTWQKREVKNGSSQPGGKKLSHADDIRQQARWALAKMDERDREASGGAICKDGDIVSEQSQKLPGERRR